MVGSGDGNEYLVDVAAGADILLIVLLVGLSCIMIVGSVGVTSGKCVDVYTFTTVKRRKTKNSVKSQHLQV